MALAFVAAAAMLGTAWAVDGVSYENGGTIDIAVISKDVVYKPNAEGTIRVNISGDLGKKDALNTNNFKIYGTKDGANGSANFTVNWGTSKLYTNGGFTQIIAGGVGSNLKDSSMIFNSAETSEIYEKNGSAQKSLLLAAGPEGGTVSGNTTLTINGKLGSAYEVSYLKATAGGLLNEDSTSDSIVVEGDSTVNFNADWKTGEDSETALLAGPMIQKDGKASSIVKGAAIVTVDGGGAVREMWAAGALLNKGTPSLTVGSAGVQILKGSVDDTIFAGAEIWAKGTATVLGDTSIAFSGGTMGENNGRARLYAGHDVETEGGKGYINGDSHIKITGGKGIRYVFGGGLAWNSTTSETQSVIHGGSNIDIVSDSGLSALTENSMIFAGGRRPVSSEAIVSVEKNGTVTFKDITKAYKGTVSRQGTQSSSSNGDYVADYNDSVSGDSVLVFDNVQADFSGATIVEMDRIELTNGTKLKLADLGGATVIKLTGNWTNFGTPSVLTFDSALENVPVVDVSEATGIVSAAFNEAKTELVVSCKNTPIAVTPTTLKLHPGESSTIKAMTYAAGETVSWKSSDESVATVDGNGKVTAHKAGIAVISDTGSVSRTTAGCTVTVEDPASPDPVPTPAPVTPTVVTEKDNPVKTDKNVPADVKPAPPVITPATEENTIALAASADVPVKFFTATADGNITVDPVTAKKAVASVMSDDVAVAPKTIMTLPVIAAAIDSGKVAALAMKTTGAQLGAAANNIVSDITLIKILRDGTGAKFGYTAEPAGYADQSFTLKNVEGNNLAFTDKIDPTATYTLILFVKDNGEFDYDKTMGSVIDPVAMAMNEAKAPKPSGGSSSGCSAGLGVLALLALLPLAAVRRKR
ncbi:Ig-like domain-containing protein [Cloacibacillus sp.]|uniref:Ig-like domain-containing protein n=1 Tax=Cloacibacillus sp. TaxID=2049023 RepID=UPI0025C401DD|nr:Ig-like domain-containing protein [Cloacibacillus sp.]MCC8057476.1 Ig-like domain-containing protein [Cloacibacillus sp.]